MTLSKLHRIDASGAPVALTTNEDRLAALKEGEKLHREFRPLMADDYAAQAERLFADGAQLTQLVDGGQVRSLALWRVFHTTYSGRRFEIDDLVTDEASRSRGYGATLLRHLEDRARELGCPVLTLNSATWRTKAHRFYYREGYAAMAFHFVKTLSEEGAAQAPR